MSDSLEPARDPADAKAWFYLDHRDDIEAWAQLRSEGARLVEDRLKALADDVGALAESLGADFYGGEQQDGPYPGLGLTRVAWRRPIGPDIAIVLQWSQGKLLGPQDPWPYIGIRQAEQPADPDVRQRLAQAMKSIRAADQAKNNAPWLAWRYVDLPPGEPVNPDLLAMQVVPRLAALWELAAPQIDQALGT